MGWLVNAWQDSAARRELASLAQSLGLGDLPVTSDFAPGLLAAADQHAAAVRDILLFSGDQVAVYALAGYARGVCDVAAEGGWQAESRASDPDWAAHWVNLRLMAVCLLATTGTVAVGVLDGDADPSVAC